MYDIVCLLLVEQQLKAILHSIVIWRQDWKCQFRFYISYAHISYYSSIFTIFTIFGHARAQGVLLPFSQECQYKAPAFCTPPTLGQAVARKPEVLQHDWQRSNCRVMPSFDFDNVDDLENETSRSSSFDYFSWDTATGRGFVHASGKVVLQATGHGGLSHSIREWLRLHRGFAVSRLPEVLTEIVGGSTNRKTNIMASVLLQASKTSKRFFLHNRSDFAWKCLKYLQICSRHRRLSHFVILQLMASWSFHVFLDSFEKLGLAWNLRKARTRHWRLIAPKYQHH